MKSQNKPFTLLEVLVAISLVVLSASFLGWKMRERVVKKRLDAGVEKLRSRLETVRALALNMQADWRGVLISEGKKGAVLRVYCIEDEKVPEIPLLSLESLEWEWNGEKKREMVFDFTASGEVSPRGCLQFWNGKEEIAQWIFPDLFFCYEGDRLGPLRPNEIKNGRL